MKEIEIENIGGISELTYSFDEDVLFVTGPNATNKTSLLEAISFALGHSDVSIKSDADHARVKLTIGDQTVERFAERTAHGIRTSGESLLDEEVDTAIVENFACLLELNPLRQAIRRKGDFETILKEPFDINALKREQQQKIEHKRTLNDRLDKLESVDTQLEACESTLEEARNRAESLEKELDELREEYSETNTENDELDTLREERASLTSRRERYVTQRQELEEAIERLESRKEELEADLESAMEKVEANDASELKQERANLRAELEEFEDRLDILQSVYTANREMLGTEYTGVLGKESGLMEDTVTCWACGGSAPPEAFEETLEELQSLIERDRQQKREYEPRLSELSEQIQETQAAESRLQSIRNSIQEIDQQLENRRESLETKQEQCNTVDEEIESYTERIQQAETENTSTASELAQKIEDTRLELHNVEDTIEDVEGKRERLEEQLEERDAIREELEELSEEITTLTERIDGLEERLRTSFNASMDDLIDALEFEGIDRVWLTGNFELVIAREIDGRTRRDSVENLSESEREMIGLVLALSGYLTYDVADKVSVLVLDTLGAFDAMRTERLLEFFAEKADILVSSTLPEVSIDQSYDTMTHEVRTSAQ